MNEAYSVPPYILYSVPGFLILIGVELLVGRAARKQFYRLNDSISDLTLGTYSRIIGAFYAGGFFLLYVFLYEKFRVFEMPAAPADVEGTLAAIYNMDALWAWVIGFLGVDMLYYWFHRTSHQVAVVWGSHEPHHSSEEYNLAVALRQGSFQGVFSNWFYLPLALVGLHPIIYLTASQFTTLYQFWIHTRHIGKMWAPFEWIFNTPSHHRVHHGINPKYIDKNHGGTLIIWDKMFGTFQAEEEEPVYGTVKPLGTWNPVWATIQYWIGLAKKTRQVKGLKNKIMIWFAKPGWQPAEMGGPKPIPEVDAATFQKYDPPIPGNSGTYAFVHFAIMIPVFVVYALFLMPDLFTPAGILGALFILFSLMNVGLILDGRPLVFGLELFRTFLITVGGLYVGYALDMLLEVGLPVATFGLVSTFWFLKYWKAAGMTGGPKAPVAVAAG